MPLFGPRKVEDDGARAALAELRVELTELRAELTRAESVVRQIEAEVIGMHDQVRRWMRRAVAAERAAERNQEPTGIGHDGQPEATPAPRTSAAPLSRVTLRGARARIAARRQLEAQTAMLRRLSEGAPSPIQAPEVDVETSPPTEATNGVHS